MKANEILRVLEQYRNSSYKKILIDGPWGIGKTKYIDDFIANHTNSCYVSLFGKKDVEAIHQEIYFRILENAPRGKFKKFVSMVGGKTNSVDISISGLSLSVPLIQNTLKTINKELKERNTFVIVFDDLERKHDDLDIKEVFGLIDSLSKVDNIKIVLVAATDNINNEDNKNYLNFREKAIDRIYSITDFADEAPKAILGTNVWMIVEKIATNFSFNNLRTYEKLHHFINEVTQSLGDNVFSDKFSKDDVYRMCFATVIFNVEHKGEMLLINTSDDRKDATTKAMYEGESSGKTAYLSNYILKYSPLTNTMCRLIFPLIDEWFRTGSYNEEEITTLITTINNYQEKPTSFYSSEDQIVAMINNTRSYILELQEDEKIVDIIANLTTALSWCEVLQIDFGIDIEKIIELVHSNILYEVNTMDGLNSWYPPADSENVRKIISRIIQVSNNEYLKKQVHDVKLVFENKRFEKYGILNALQDALMANRDEATQREVAETIQNNNFFFPVPAGILNEEHWNWCHLIKGIIQRIETQWQIKGYYKKFELFAYSLHVNGEERLMKHRLNTLFGKGNEDRTEISH
ncbi:MULTISPECIES: ATP-binding protein [unclassified Paenibacillus]|uniref:ATP-binding protein n=1 Tax=unclassified Paenibacillus TaxID=185978 RepID=UPI0009A67D84|nr:MULTISPECIES: ATP-binding protein [unclassified Paenibacillus]SLK16158.1 ATPase [Paenibacillus sp. RU5A]SOC74228.1 ATPase [Paenibacillus sp. RU26A]SOC76378.1 ATPase [Paenibacillus sp. RU5M]